MNEENVMPIREKIFGMPDVVMAPSFMACPGCQHPTVGRIVAELLMEMGIDGKAIGIMGVGCTGSLMAMTNIDVILPAHGRGPDAATGIKRVRPDTFVWTLQGDGDCMAIGAGPLVGALTRGEKITIIMGNNTNYGTTGGQLSPTTIRGQVTTTAPRGRGANEEGYPTHAAEMVAGFKGCAYSARTALTTPYNYQRTKRYIRAAFQKQLDNVGLSFVEVITACPVNWHKTPVECLEWIEDKLLAEYPLGEFKNVDNIE